MVAVALLVVVLEGVFWLVLVVGVRGQGLGVCVVDDVVVVVAVAVIVDVAVVDDDEGSRILPR